MTALFNGHLMQDDLAKPTSSHWSHSHPAISFASKQLPSRQRKTLRLLERRNQTLPQRCFQKRCSSIKHAITHYANSPRYPKWECSCLASTSTLFSVSLSNLPTFLLQKRHFSATAGHPCPHPDLIQKSTEMSCTLHAMKCFLGQEKQQH